MILNEVIFDPWQLPKKRPKREKKEELIASKKYTEENLGWMDDLDCSSLSRSSSSH
jgi:hypothetical protein